MFKQRVLPLYVWLSKSCCTAFDKGDLLYLRDEEEKRRFMEMELRDSEQQQFAKARAKVESDRAAAALRAAQARKDKLARYTIAAS